MSSMFENDNRVLVEQVCRSNPCLTSVAPAGKAIPGMHAHRVLHAGPPIEWPVMPAAMQAAICGALVFEGLAGDLADARKRASDGDIEFESANDHQAAGAMAGIITASMPVFIVEDDGTGTRAFVSINEGLGKALRFGANDLDVLTRLDWIRTRFAPLLADALARHGPISLKLMIAEALRRGDEAHNRNKAATSQFVRELAPDLVETGGSHSEIATALRFIGGNDHFFLSLSIAHAKCISLAVESMKRGSLVTVMSGNGREVGIRVSGTGSHWYKAAAEVADVRLFPGHNIDDATPTMGDSYVTETIGLGGFALAAAPAIAEFIGGNVPELTARSEQMRQITAGEHTDFVIPQLGFRGVPVGIDVLKVVSTGLTPIVNTGVASRRPGIGQIGAGVQNFPLAPFQMAAEALTSGSAAAVN